jgi:hypothetical protein
MSYTKELAIWFGLFSLTIFIMSWNIVKYFISSDETGYLFWAIVAVAIKLIWQFETERRGRKGDFVSIKRYNLKNLKSN